MRLVAFRIKNFRSIVDSGWCNLSADNITGFIGQNESGKTSVLEAQHSFYTKVLDNDYLRSDGQMPVVCCSFEVAPNELAEMFPDEELPKGLTAWLKAHNNRVNLQRAWSSVDASELTLEQAELAALFPDPATIPIPAPKPIPTPAPVAPEEESEDGTTVTPATVELESEAVPAPEVPEETPVKSVLADDFTNALAASIPAFVYFSDFQSLIPNEIDIADITKKNAKVEGLYGALNFLTIIGLKPEDLLGANQRLVESKIESCNKKVTADFHEFWSQHIGKNNKIEIQMQLKHHSTAAGKTKAGEPYLVFWVKDGSEILYPKQRSKGVRWFLSFYLQLKASAILHSDGQVLLIDEPGASLHAKAQEDVLKVFEAIKDKLQILYTTHSPYLIKPETLYRLLAVQRDDEDDEKSATKIFDVHHLGQATTDTMFPVYTLIGADLGGQRVIKDKDNVLLEEPSAFYYLSAFKNLTGESRDIHFLPATGVTKVPVLANLLMGWSIEYGTVVDDDSSGRAVYKDLKHTLYGNNDTEARKHLYKIKDCKGVEDIFSKGDFKKHVIEDNTATLGDSNSEYLKQSASKSPGVSKIVLAYKFYQKVEAGKIKLTDLSKETQSKIAEVMASIVALL